MTSPTPPQRRDDLSPPLWLTVLLSLCAVLLLVYLIRALSTDTTVAAAATPAPTAAETATPAPTPPPTPEPTPVPYDYTQPIPEGEPVAQEEWFADAVFIGDSRIDGFKLFSGVTPKASFLDYTGLTVFDIAEGKNVIRSGSKKITIPEALAQQSYGKVYIALGLNELGYFDAQGFADTYAQFIDTVRELQPDALIYVQSIIPVNAVKCKANDIPDYITNQGVAEYNQALAGMCADKQVFLVGVPDALLDDETGEAASELSADGVHFKREGYGLWLDYLIRHTGN